MVGDLPGQVQDPTGDGVGADVDVVHGAVVLADDTSGELPGLPLAEQPRGGLDRLAQGVVGHDPPRVGVVGGDRGLPVELLLGELLGGAQLLQAFAHAFGQLGRGLAGEGQAEDLFGPHQTVGDQPDHT